MDSFFYDDKFLLLDIILYRNASQKGKDRVRLRIGVTQQIDELVEHNFIEQ
jgi:hypothetical protein